MIQKKVLVTGANGYIGTHVTKVVLDNGMQVVAADIKLDNVDDRAQKVMFDFLSDEEVTFEALGDPDIVIHLAWRDGFMHNSDNHINDVPKHMKFIKKMIDFGVKNINIMGSMHEIGYYEGAIDENTPANPLSLYGIGKNSLREICKVLTINSDIAIKWLRGFYILGDDLKNHSIFTKLIEASNDGKTTFPFNSGKCKYDFTDINELARQISAAALQTEVVNEINCCSGKPVALGEKVEEFIKDKGLNIKLEYGKFPDRAYDSPAVWGDNKKMLDILDNTEIA